MDKTMSGEQKNKEIIRKEWRYKRLSHSWQSFTVCLSLIVFLSVCLL